MTPVAVACVPRRHPWAAPLTRPAIPLPGAMSTSAERSEVTEPRAAEPKTEFIDVDGVKLRVATRAGRSGTPLLLFNGIGANLEVVYPFIAALPEREVIVFDMPGIGRSPLSVVPRRFSGIARLTNGLLDRLGYPEVDVAGV